MIDARAILPAIAMAGLLAGCGPDRTAGATGVGNPTKGMVTVALVAVDSLPAAAGVDLGPTRGVGKVSATVRNPDGSFDIRDAGGTVFTVRSGFANVGRIRIALPDSLQCSDDGDNECESGTVTFRGPWVSDLMTGSWSPDLGAVRLPVGAYRRVDIRLEAQEDSPGPGPDLARHSLIYSGTFDYQGRADRPFRIALDFDEDARFESADGFALDTGSNAITISLRISDWLARVDLTSCLDSGAIPLDDSGGFVFEKDGNCELEQDLKEALKGSGSVHGGRHDESDDRHGQDSVATGETH